MKPITLYFCGIVLSVIVFPLFFGSRAPNIEGFQYDSTPFDSFTFVTSSRGGFTADRIRTLKIALSSWLDLSPYTQIILVVDEYFDKDNRIRDFLVKNFGEGRIWTTKIQQNIQGYHYFSSVVNDGFALARTRFICYTSIDMVYDAYWYDRMLTYAMALQSNFLLTGMRYDIDDNLYLTNPVDLERWLRIEPYNHSKIMHSLLRYPMYKVDQDGTDYFIIPAGEQLWDYSQMPQFFMAGYHYDQYFLGTANSKGKAVSVGHKIPAIHLPPSDDGYSICVDCVRANNKLASGEKNMKQAQLAGRLVTDHQLQIGGDIFVPPSKVNLTWKTPQDSRHHGIPQVDGDHGGNDNF